MRVTSVLIVRRSVSMDKRVEMTQEEYLELKKEFYARQEEAKDESKIKEKTKEPKG